MVIYFGILAKDFVRTRKLIEPASRGVAVVLEGLVLFWRRILGRSGVLLVEVNVLFVFERIHFSVLNIISKRSLRKI